MVEFNLSGMGVCVGGGLHLNPGKMNLNSEKMHLKWGKFAITGALCVSYAFCTLFCAFVHTHLVG